MRRRVGVAAAGAGVVVAIGAGGVAVAAGGDDGPVSQQYTQRQANAATKAALEATGGGMANSVESDSEDGATYEVEVTKPDGSTVDVRLDESYRVVVIEGDGEEPASNRSRHEERAPVRTSCRTPPGCARVKRPATDGNSR